MATGVMGYGERVSTVALSARHGSVEPLRKRTGRRLMAGIVGVVLTFGCSVSDPATPPLIGTPQEPNQSGEQAETDAVVAQALDGTTTIVVGHRFTGPYFLNNEPGQNPDIFYGPNTADGVVFRRGSSIMGRSFSTNGGFAWQAPGKIYPEFGFGDPVALLWSDPALAVGYANKSLVAYASLAVSKQSFDAVTSGTDAQDLLFGWPPDVDTPDGQGIVDSVCVALSFDGGLQFQDVVCARDADVGIVGTDQTTAAIGRGDRVYVAVDDFSDDEILLYELIYLGVPAPFLNKIPVDPLMGSASHGPELRRDQSGEVWMSGTDAFGTVKLCRVTDQSCEFVGNVTSNVDLFAILPAGVASPQTLRSGSSADFAVNRVVAAELMLREFIFAYSRTGNPTLGPYVGLTRCVLASLSGALTCEDVDEWGTLARLGMQLQPNIDLVDKSEAQDGFGADWRYAFYEFDRPEIGNGRAQIALATLSGTLPSAISPTVTFQPLGAPDPLVCPARYPSGDYWGDYFALVAVPPIPTNPNWRHVAVYSSDESRGCESSHPRQGRNLHVVSWGWVD